MILQDTIYTTDSCDIIIYSYIWVMQFWWCIGDREAPRSHRGVMHSHLIDSWWTGARSKKIDGGSVQIWWDQQRRSGINRGIDPRQRSLRRSIRGLQISGGHLGGLTRLLVHWSIVPVFWVLQKGENRLPWWALFWERTREGSSSYQCSKEGI